jgi:hypothetical protein
MPLTQTLIVPTADAPEHIPLYSYMSDSILYLNEGYDWSILQPYSEAPLKPVVRKKSS